MLHTTAPATAEQVRDDYLSYYSGGTRRNYETDLRQFFDWCDRECVHPFEARRTHMEAFARYLTDERGNSPRSVDRRFTPIRGFYRLAVADDLIDRDPTHLARLPKWSVDRSKIAWVNRADMAALLTEAERRGPAQHALIALMAFLGLRVSEACSIQLEDVREDHSGYTTVTVTRKGGMVRVLPVPIPLLKIIGKARGDRAAGALILTARGNPQNRNGAYHWVKQMCQRAGLPETYHPHSIRHGAVTGFIRSGATILEAQAFADHADIRMTEHYFHHQPTFEQHGSHAVARYFAAA